MREGAVCRGGMAQQQSLAEERAREEGRVAHVTSTANGRTQETRDSQQAHP